MTGLFFAWRKLAVRRPFAAKQHLAAEHHFVGAGLLAMAILRLASHLQASSPANQRLQERHYWSDRSNQFCEKPLVIPEKPGVD